MKQIDDWIKAIQYEKLSVMADITGYGKGYSSGLDIAIGILDGGEDREAIKSEYDHWNHLYSTEGRDDFKGRRDAFLTVLQMK